MSKKIFTVPPDYPFIDDLKRFQALHKHTAKHITTVTMDNKTVTLQEKVIYSNAPTTFYTKLFKHTAILNDLSFASCKLVLYVCCLLEMGQYSLKLTAEDTDMDAKTFAKAMLELTHCNFIRKVKGKRSMYWVNLIMAANGDTRNAQIDSSE